jgi:hypothetical protein
VRDRQPTPVPGAILVGGRLSGFQASRSHLNSEMMAELWWAVSDVVLGAFPRLVNEHSPAAGVHHGGRTCRTNARFATSLA